MNYFVKTFDLQHFWMDEEYYSKCENMTLTIHVLPVLEAFFDP